jgi:hypothetical protein
MRQVSAITPLTTKCISACNPAGSRLGIAIPIAIAATAHFLKESCHFSIVMTICDVKDVSDLRGVIARELMDAVLVL